MSSAVFAQKKFAFNWKPCFIASLVIASASYTVFANQPNSTKSLSDLFVVGKIAEDSGDYRLARRDFDLALLQARGRGDKNILLDALVNCAKIDNEFDEDKLAISLAREAVGLSEKLSGKHSLQYAKTVAVFANLLTDDDEALKLYSQALAILENNTEGNSIECARIYTNMSACFESKGESGEAISAAKSALSIFEQADDAQSSDYADALIQYTMVADLDDSEKQQKLLTALHDQEFSSGMEHPRLSPTLNLIAATEPVPLKKLTYLERAQKIDAKAFGRSSIQVVRTLMARADIMQLMGNKEDALKLRQQSAEICRTFNRIESVSSEFLTLYEEMLRGLQFDAEANRIGDILKKREKADAAASRKSLQSDTEIEVISDIENDPEYWLRSAEVSIEGVEKFRSASLNHLQLWYDKGALSLSAFNRGKLIWSSALGNCNSGIVNSKFDNGRLTVSWRDGDGPLWHKDVYRVEANKLVATSKSTTDAFAQQLDQQLEDVIGGKKDSLEEGAVDAVPVSYLNLNFLADAIRRGEHKALQVYGNGDAATAAERLSAIFDLTTKASNSKHEELDNSLSHCQRWVSAWQKEQLPVADYITALNDYGFFLQQSGDVAQSAEVLSLTARIAPQRAVAHLNLADSLWKLGKKDLARQSYGAYLQLLHQQAGDTTVPSRVIQRIS